MEKMQIKITIKWNGNNDDDDDKNGIEDGDGEYRRAVFVKL